MDAVTQLIRPDNDKGMAATIHEDSGMVTSIQSKSHVCNHEPIHAVQTYVILVWGVETLTNHSTNSSMRTYVMKSSMTESRLITGQWWEPFTSARETTNNFNGSQGTANTIH